MKPVDLHLPDGSKVYNFLYRTSDPNYLVSDILTVCLPNEYCIDVSYKPEHDPAGAYFVRVFWRSWDMPKTPDLRLNNVEEVIQAVEALASKFSFDNVTISNSETANVLVN